MNGDITQRFLYQVRYSPVNICVQYHWLWEISSCVFTVLAFHTRDGVPITWLSPGNHWAITSQHPLDCFSLLLKISLTVAWVALTTIAYSRKHSADPFSSAVKWTIKTELTHDGTVLRFVLSNTQNWNNYQHSGLAWFQGDWNNKPSLCLLTERWLVY